MSNTTLQIVRPKNGEIVPLQTEMQKEFLAMDRSAVTPETFDWLNRKREEEKENSRPVPVVVEWEPNVPGRVQISETEDFSDSFSVTGNGYAEVCNLKIATKYYVRVCAEERQSESVVFQTEDTAPRFLFVDGATNVRDCGGWKNKDGKRVRQGVFYRGSELNGHSTVRPEGIRTLLETMNIQTDLDLRGDHEERENVLQREYRNISCNEYGGFLLEPGICREIFEFLADEAATPLYYHCRIGADRTGTVAFLLGALLGVEEKSLLDDYESTSLSTCGARIRSGESFQNFREKLNLFTGENINEKVESYLLFCGVTAEQIRKIRALLLEDTPEIE